MGVRDAEADAAEEGASKETGEARKERMRRERLTDYERRFPRRLPQCRCRGRRWQAAPAAAVAPRRIAGIRLPGRERIYSGAEEPMADEPINLVLEHLQAIRAGMTAMNDKLDRVVVEQRTHSRLLDVLKQEGRLLRSAVNDIAKENVTPGEVEAIHQDLTQLQHDVVSLQVRMDQIEEREKTGQ
jgi:hypothetical protein